MRAKSLLLAFVALSLFGCEDRERDYYGQPGSGPGYGYSGGGYEAGYQYPPNQYTDPYVMVRSGPGGTYYSGIDDGYQVDPYSWNMQAPRQFDWQPIPREQMIYDDYGQAPQQDFYFVHDPRSFAENFEQDPRQGKVDQDYRQFDPGQGYPEPPGKYGKREYHRYPGQSDQQYAQEEQLRNGIHIYHHIIDESNYSNDSSFRYGRRHHRSYQPRHGLPGYRHGCGGPNFGFYNYGHYCGGGNMYHYYPTRYNVFPNYYSYIPTYYYPNAGYYYYYPYFRYQYQGYWYYMYRRWWGW